MFILKLTKEFKKGDKCSSKIFPLGGDTDRFLCFHVDEFSYCIVKFIVNSAILIIHILKTLACYWDFTKFLDKLNIPYDSIVPVDVCSSKVLSVFFRAMIKSGLSSRAMPFTLK